jgi:hypothetical protein
MEANADLKERESSRSAMVILTATGIGFTNRHRQQVVEALENGPAVVLAVQVDDVGGPLGPAQGEVSQVDYEYVLAQLTEKTGGRREVLLSPMSVDKVLDAFAAELKAQYRLSYLSADKGRVEIKLARPGLKVRMGSVRP